MKVYQRTPLNINQMKAPHGQVYVIPERCKGCELCVHFCPRQVLQVSNQSNSKGYHYPELVGEKTDACVNCEFCTLVCPEFAIFTLPSNGNRSEASKLASNSTPLGAVAKGGAP